MARGSKAQLEVFAQALAAGNSPFEAARIAKYPKGSSFRSNARKRAQRADVKAMVEALLAPSKAKALEQIEANFDWAFQHHRSIVEAALNNSENEATITEAQRSLDAMAKLMGWYKPEKVETTLNADSLDRAFASIQANRAG